MRQGCALFMGGGGGQKVKDLEVKGQGHNAIDY